MSETIAWPAHRGGEALRQLFEVLALDPKRLEVSDDAPLAEWIVQAVAQTDRTVDPVQLRYDTAEQFVTATGPALLELPDDTLLVVLRGGARSTRVLNPDGRVQTIDNATLTAMIRRGVVDELGPRLQSLLPPGGSKRSRQRALAKLIGLTGAERTCGRAWLLRVPPHAPMTDQLRQSSIVPGAVGFVTAQVATRLLQSAGWAWIVAAVLGERLGPGALGIWAALLATAALVHTLGARLGGGLSIALGSLVRRRLMWGALRVDLDEGRSRGIGQLLGLVLEGTSMETAAIQSALAIGVAAIEALGLLVALVVLGQPALALAFALLLALVVRRGRRLAVARQRWTDLRLSMTHGFIEDLLGHRTRRTQGDAQADARRDHRDRQRYQRASIAADAQLGVLWGALPMVWMLVAIAIVAGSTVVGTATRAELAVGVGLALYGASLLREGGRRLAQVVDNFIGLRLVLPLWRAGASRPRPGLPGVRVDEVAPDRSRLLEARQLSFAHPGGRRLLEDLDLTLGPTERVLLLGASGSGKSTLVDLLTGLRTPHGGVLRLAGVDATTLGPWRWRRRVLAIHQFSANHIFSETLAFNLLLGRGWPPTDDDLARAERVCRALDLGPLLDAMPAGLMQLVGEGGWSLSHGERTRVFLARALLQEPWVMVLDETLSALDPVTLQQVAGALARHQGATIAVAHP